MSEELMHGLDTTPDVWDFMQQHGLNDAHIAIAAQNITAAGITRAYFAVPTPVPQALEIWAIIASTKFILQTTAIGASVATYSLLSGRNSITYTQPQPPATNGTTDAATAGNLQFRNVFYDRPWRIGTGITQPATVGTQLGPEAQTYSDILFLKKPRKIACSQLEIQINTTDALNVAFSDVDLSVDVFYKMVQVSESEYSALVALASGQAVLTQVIIA